MIRQVPALRPWQRQIQSERFSPNVTMLPRSLWQQWLTWPKAVLEGFPEEETSRLCFWRANLPSEGQGHSRKKYKSTEAGQHKRVWKGECSMGFQRTGREWVRKVNWNSNVNILKYELYPENSVCLCLGRGTKGFNKGCWRQVSALGNPSLETGKAGEQWVWCKQ